MKTVGNRLAKLETRHGITGSTDIRYMSDFELMERIRQEAAPLVAQGYVMPDLETDDGLRQYISDMERLAMQEAGSA